MVPNMGSGLDSHYGKSKDAKVPNDSSMNHATTSASRPDSGGRLLSHHSLSPGVSNRKRQQEAFESEDGRCRVLLVEDNVINQRLLHKKLQTKGFDFSIANNETVDVIQDAANASDGVNGPFDVILMDQEMPVLNGNDATREIRAREQSEGSHIPILGVTANVRKAQQGEILDSGMDDVISKSYTIDDLVDKIHNMIGGG